GSPLYLKVFSQLNINGQEEPHQRNYPLEPTLCNHRGVGPIHFGPTKHNCHSMAIVPKTSCWQTIAGAWSDGAKTILGPFRITLDTAFHWLDALLFIGYDEP